MLPNELLVRVFGLSLPDRLDLFEQLRDNIRNDPDLAPPTDEERRILDERLVDFEAEEGSTWEEVELRIIRALDERRDERL